MRFLACLVLLAALALIACDSDGSDPEPPTPPEAAVGLAVTDPAGDPVGGLSATLEYEFVPQNEEGNRRGGDPTGPEVVLTAVYPNPFVERALIEIVTRGTTKLRVEVADLTGEVLTVLSEREFERGIYQIVWEPADNAVPDGVYAARLVAADTIAASRPILHLEGTQGALFPPFSLVVNLGETNYSGTVAFDERERLPQLYDTEVEYRNEETIPLGVLVPTDDITLVLRDGDGREQRYERVLADSLNGFTLTWDPQ